MGTHTYKILIEADMSKIMSQVQKLETSLSNVDGPNLDLNTKQMISEIRGVIDKLQKELNSLKLNQIKLSEIDSGPLVKLRKEFNEINKIIEQINKKTIELNLNQFDKDIEKMKTSLQTVVDLRNDLLGKIEKTNSSSTSTVPPVDDAESKKYEKSIKHYNKLVKAKEIFESQTNGFNVTGSFDDLEDQLYDIEDKFDDAADAAKDFGKAYKQATSNTEKNKILRQEAEAYADMLVYSKQARAIFAQMEDVNPNIDNIDGYMQVIDDMVKKAKSGKAFVEQQIASISKSFAKKGINLNNFEVSGSLDNVQNKVQQQTTQRAQKISIPISFDINAENLEKKNNAVIAEIKALKEKAEKIKIKLPLLDGVNEIKAQIKDLKEELGKLEKSSKKVADNLKDNMLTSNVPENKTGDKKGKGKNKDKVVNISDVPEVVDETAEKIKSQNQALLETSDILKSVSDSIQSFAKSNNEIIKSNEKVLSSIGKIIEKYNEYDNLEKKRRNKTKQSDDGISDVEKNLEKTANLYESLKTLQGQMEISTDLPTRTQTFKDRARDLVEKSKDLFSREDITDVEELKKEIDSLAASFGALMKDTSLLKKNKKGELISEGSIKNIDDAKQALLEYAETYGKVKKNTLKVNSSSGILSVDVASKTGEMIKLKGAIDDVNSAIRVSNTSVGSTMSSFDKLSSSAHKIFNNFKNLFSGPMIFNRLENGFRDGFNFVKELDRQLTTISSTMPTTKQGLADLGRQSILTAKEMGITVDSVTEVAEIYANTQETLQGIMTKSSPTLKLSNASGLSTGTSADIVQGVLLQYKELEGQEEHIVDGIEKISASLKMNFGEGIENMSTALRKSGSVAKEAGLEFEELVALSGKISETTRESGEVTGNALKYEALAA